MEKIKKAVDEFKSENGNEKYTQKELLMYIIKRLDKLPCEEHVTLLLTKCGEFEIELENVKTQLTNYKWFAGFILGIVGVFIALKI